MIEWLSEYWASLTWGHLAFGAFVFVASFVLSILIVAVVIVKIPANYFSSHYTKDFLPNASWITRWGATIIKNLVGVVLILAGIAMLIGPGQGVLTILIGLIMLDIPGKRPIEAKIIGRPGVLAAANKLRERYGKPPLILD
jgi:hypothetical protein